MGVGAGPDGHLEPIRDRARPDTICRALNHAREPPRNVRIRTARAQRGSMHGSAPADPVPEI
jgi:hypothetical protein